MIEEVILVDDYGNKTGYIEKLAAHKRGNLHLAVSGFIYNHEKGMLLVREVEDEYKRTSRWSNACCTHPEPGENALSAINRQLYNQLGIDWVTFSLKGSLKYRVELRDGLIEHEYASIFHGVYNGEINPDPKKIIDSRWESTSKIKEDLLQNPNEYTPWFRLIMDKHF